MCMEILSGHIQSIKEVVDAALLNCQHGFERKLFV